MLLSYCCDFNEFVEKQSDPAGLIYTYVLDYFKFINLS